MSEDHIGLPKMEQLNQFRGLWNSDPSIQPNHRGPIEGRLNAVLCSWRGTVYSPRSAIKGRGADCIGFVAAVVDELYRCEFGVRGSPCGFSHGSQEFVDFFKNCRTLWPVQDTKTLDCGDIILDRTESGHAHVYITGALPYTLWHSLHGFGVVASGFERLGSNLSFFRLMNKETWI